MYWLVSVGYGLCGVGLTCQGTVDTVAQTSQVGCASMPFAGNITREGIIDGVPFLCVRTINRVRLLSDRAINRIRLLSDRTDDAVDYPKCELVPRPEL